jgi:hypothetical protein
MATLPTLMVMTNYPVFWRKLSQGVLWPLFLFASSCHTPPAPWKVDIVKAMPGCASFRRLYYSSPDPFCNVQVEILDSRNCRRIFINIFSLAVAANEPCENTIPVNISSPEEEQVFQAYVYKGGQRLLLPSYSYAWIIENLQKGNTLNLQVGRYSTTLLPSNFPKT